MSPLKYANPSHDGKMSENVCQTVSLNKNETAIAHQTTTNPINKTQIKPTIMLTYQDKKHANNRKQVMWLNDQQMDKWQQLINPISKPGQTYSWKK